ncbi:hypothetical protein SORBI_3003G098650 [Sorghum bicolor]|uniref:Uncharacterized protein n=1 Tax=Sorghum bicolor TaxID=4558 RepID=A0A1W0VWL8_SORBI|nr:hypothetical protein SORBI_3003G098650 [Sorghum bicolor]OQU86497.1 hypothetical protein SORBI_3003G098650 [Sorghum bicolor]
MAAARGQLWLGRRESTQTSDPICVGVQRKPKYASALLRLSPRPKSVPRRPYNRLVGGERRGKLTQRPASQRWRDLY